MKKFLLFLGLISMICTEYINAECIACQPADTSQERSMVKRKAIRARKMAELQAQCKATNIPLKTQCEAQEANQDPKVRMFGNYQITGECINNCLQCTCRWVES